MSTALVYSCSGCLGAGQLANAVALKLDRAGVAEMSCIAGIGADVPSMLCTARSGRPIIALDGCDLACAKNTLARHDIDPSLHVLLSDQCARRRFHAEYDPVQAQRMFTSVSRQIARLASDRNTLPPALVRRPVVEEAAR